MSEIKNRKWGDRRDGHFVKDVPGLQAIMLHLWPNRTDCEVFLHDTIDATKLMQYLEKKNASHPEYKTTIFHALVTACARMVRERPKMNRFIQGHRMYQRDEVSLSFVAKRRFADEAVESLLWMVPKDEENLDDVSKKIYGDVREVRKSEVATGGVDQTLDNFAKLPRLLLMFVVRIIRYLDFWGKVPRALSDGDPNYSTIMLTNLGSIQCPSVYHHLSNYGTLSIVVALGNLHKEERLMPDGTKEIRDVVDIGVTLDERIGDGFYFAKSLRLIHHIMEEEPELLDLPLGQPSNFDYEQKK